MTLFALFSLVVVAIAALAWLAVGGQRSQSAKMFAYFCFIASVSACGIGFSNLLGKPKPIEWTIVRDATAMMSEAEVIAAQMIEDEAIYVWLNLESEDEPRAYRFPWSKPMARSLHEARREAEQKGTKVKVADNKKRKKKLDSPLEFYATPVQSGPTKALVDESPIDANQLIFTGNQ